MAKKYIADNIDLASDLSMVSTSSGEQKIVIGNTDGSQTTNDYSRIHITGKSTATSSTTGAELVLNTGGSGLGRVLFNTAYDFNSTNSYRTASVGYNGGSNAQFYISHGQLTGQKNIITLDPSYTNFNTPLRIGTNATANELDDFEEGDANLTFGVSYAQPGSGIAFFSGAQPGDFSSWSDNSKYVKVGSSVTVYIDITFSNSSASPSNWLSSSYSIFLGGLPFGVAGSYTSDYNKTSPLHGDYSFGINMMSYSNDVGFQIRPYKWGTYGMYFGFSSHNAYQTTTPLRGDDFNYTIGYSQYGVRQITGVIHYRTTQ